MEGKLQAKCSAQKQKIILFSSVNQLLRKRKTNVVFGLTKIEAGKAFLYDLFSFRATRPAIFTFLTLKVLHFFTKKLLYPSKQALNRCSSFEITSLFSAKRKISKPKDKF